MSAQTEKVASAKILEAAADLFAERGYSNVSVRDICRQAETTPPMIYYYFGSKKGLFEAAAKSRVSLKDFVERLETSGEDAKRALLSFVRTYLSDFPESAFDVGLYINETASLDRKNTKRVVEQFQEIHEIATGIIRDGVKRGAFRESQPERAADLLLGLLNHFVFQRIHFMRVFDVESTSEYITGFFLRAMR
ncbi:MAG: TetR/AcrR family transcriptional regulator [Nitrososphaerota archaeon]|nr:TetR/AcrR family transcriptional regulator [Nitrososphaerota archaeon]